MPERLRFLSGGGETGALLRACDWSATPLGSPATWPGPLKTLVGVMLAANQPMFVAWGPGRTLLYNDAYAEILAGKHPAAMGRDFLEVWSEIRADLVPLVEQVYAGQPVQMDDITLVMVRRGYPEETHFAFSYTPVRNEAGAVAGFFCPCVETTGRVLAERRQAFLLDLEERLRGLTNPNEVTLAAAEALGRHIGAPRAGYAEMDEAGAMLTVSHDWTGGGLPRRTGQRRPLDAFGQAAAAVLRAGRVVVVEDCFADPRTAGEVVAATWAGIGIRALVAAPLVKAGTFTAFLYAHSIEPRRWSAAEVELIREVAERTWSAVERARAEAALRSSEARWRGLFEGMQEGFIIAEVVRDEAGRGVDWRYLAINPAWETVTGWSRDATVGRTLLEILPAVEPRWVETFVRVAETGEPANFQGGVALLGKWYSVHAFRTEPDRFAALFLDITERRAADERQALLTREVDHRAKNALSVALSAVRLTRAADMKSYMAAVEGRVAALSRAQTVLAEDRWHGADLEALLRGELIPFLTGGPDGSRARLSGPKVALPASAAQPLAMMFHELATNAVKYGALSLPAGRIAVVWQLLNGGEEQKLLLRWTETGGPPVLEPPTRRGFGSRMLEATLRGQLGGKIAFAWERSGLVCNVEALLQRARATEDPSPQPLVMP